MKTIARNRRSGPRVGGHGLAATAAVVSGVAVYAPGIAVRRFGDATNYTTAKNLIAALVLVRLLRLHERRQSKQKHHECQ